MRNLWEHKLRTLLLAAAVVAGVGFVTASYVFTDSLSAAFSQAFSSAAEGVDIAIQPTEEPGMTTGAFPRIDAGLVDVAAGVDGVESATPVLQALVTLVLDGEPVGDQFGPPTFGTSWSATGFFEILDGVAPSGPTDVTVDAATAAENDISIGDEISVAGVGRAEPFTVVGTFGFGEGATSMGARFLGFSFARAAELTGVSNQVNSIEVIVEESADIPAVVDALNAVLPDGAEALDSRVAAEEQAAALQEGIGFFNTFLLVFGAISLIVGAFVVYNAFRVVVAQRGRELALLRILGTTRRQLVRSVMTEALVIGIVASAIGLVAGLGLAVAIRSLLSATGSDLPDVGLVLAPRTLIIGFCVGIVTTLVSALTPALRTARISPMEALSDQPEFRKISRWWLWVGLALLALAIGLVAVGVGQAFDGAALTGDTGPLILIGIGCLVAFASFFLLARILVRPLIGLLGRGARATASVLGRENARRTPRRTAVTATALMIGLGLVATVAVLSSSVEETILGAVDDAFVADIVVQAGGFDQTAGVPVEVAAEVAEMDGVAEVARLNVIPIDLPGDETVLAVGVEPETVALAFAFENVDGSFSALGPGAFAVQRVEADRRGWEVGDEVVIGLADQDQPMELVAVFDLQGGVSDTQSFYLDYSEVRSLQNPPRDISLAVGLEEGADPEAVAEVMTEALSDFPGIAVSTVGDLVDQIRSGLNAVVAMVAGLLLMSVVVALVGIILTLYLAVFERTRETGLLRAVGMTRRQVRQMIRFESVLIAVFGTVLGVTLGLFCGWALSVGVVGEGIRFGVPWAWIVAGLLGALVAGVVAAVIPARRAARMNILDAIAYE